MEVVIKGEAKEVAALVVAIQGRQRRRIELEYKGYIPAHCSPLHSVCLNLCHEGFLQNLGEVDIAFQRRSIEPCG